MPASQVTAVQPRQAVEGGRVSVHGNFGRQPSQVKILIGESAARTVYASSHQIDVVVPGMTTSGLYPVRADRDGPADVVLEIGAPVATGLHQVDSPVFDWQGNLYLTYSGMRGEHAPVSIFKVGADGAQQTFASGIVNATSMVVDSDGALFVSSRFEGTVYRLDAHGAAAPFATDLGVACGLAFAPDGSLFVGDRSGTIFKVDRHGQATLFASLPPSVAAFHLALASDGALFVTAPTLSTYDAVYRIDRDGTIAVKSRAFGRPQGLAFDGAGNLYVAEALAGGSGIYRLTSDGNPELVVAGSGFVGLAFDSAGHLVACSSDTAFRFNTAAS
jgi:hypothetical protein